MNDELEVPSLELAPSSPVSQLMSTIDSLVSISMVLSVSGSVDVMETALSLTVVCPVFFFFFGEFILMSNMFRFRVFVIFKPSVGPSDLRDAGMVHQSVGISFPFLLLCVVCALGQKLYSLVCTQG